MVARHPSDIIERYLDEPSVVIDLSALDEAVDDVMAAAIVGDGWEQALAGFSDASGAHGAVQWAIAWTATTGESGDYLFVLLPPGRPAHRSPHHRTRRSPSM